MVQLTQSYTAGGGGFSRHPAGLSTSSAFEHVSTNKWDKIYEGLSQSGFLDRELSKIMKETDTMEEQTRKELEKVKTKTKIVSMIVRALDEMLELLRGSVEIEDNLAES